MNAELTEIRDFIKASPPFDKLPDEAAGKLTENIHIGYLRKDSSLPPKNITEPRLYIVRKGALSYLDEEHELLGKFGEGDICTVFCLPDDKIKIAVKTDEDTLLYSINWQLVFDLLQPFPEVLAYFNTSAAERLQHQVSKIHEQAVVNATLMNTSIGDFYRAPAVTITAGASIRDAAIKMNEVNLSSLLVTEKGEMAGIVTDKDIRQRCVAQGLSFELPVSDIMTRKLISIEADNNAFDALVLMTTRQIHHLPVTRDGQLAGMITVTDLIRQEGQNAVHITGAIHKAGTIKELVEISKLVPKLQRHMVKTGTTAAHVGKSISAITAAFTVRLIEMAEKISGPAPVPYVWVAAGSQARREQCCHSDQDNALIISDQAKPEHDYWFHDLATFVNDGLAACGYAYCPGNVMASNPKWRQSQQVWGQYFENWVNKPDPKALMHCSIFFDLAPVYGEMSLLTDLRHTMLEQTRGNTLFLAHLTKNALNLRPPLGFFRDFVLEKNGDNKNTLDLKHKGIAPIVDLARIYALAEGVSAVNTVERLRQVGGSASLTLASAKNLIDAVEFMGMLRIEHQVKQLQQGKVADNFLPPKQISRLEREHLKDAFKVVKSLQDVRQSVYG
ncbi:putative nucleotidyltransferase substrate binding domain-containing protein [Thalassomonas actiniarum]|uniref:Cyclic nucleotide-binding/CBS domain-containing protein n=1 Tax=Thalassomonas actiniarum TaxID=485447 RepID=A0AAE9YR99_9GAMM|nr:putative nucleotidyltransferase substrate binding domain-containing protein [Thalassomonas actiniarum]WDD99630.1 cyclic nucleotide-binding/CBS domain-containing protein [Thalassomonas actiniarum]